MPSNEEKNISKKTYESSEKDAAQTELTNAITFEDLARIINGLKFNEVTDTGKLDELKQKLNFKLTQFSAVSVAFPECSDVMLSLIKSTDIDEITGFFNDYFSFR